MEKITWNRYTRFMTAEVNYVDDPNLAYQGEVWKLEMQFDEDFSKIESGKYTVVDKMGTVKSSVTFGVAKVYTIFAYKQGTGRCVFKKTGGAIPTASTTVTVEKTLIKCKAACDTGAATCAAWSFSEGSSQACKMFNTGATKVKGKGWPVCYPTPLPPKVPEEIPLTAE
jgi:hypothetical protein